MVILISRRIIRFVRQQQEGHVGDVLKAVASVAASVTSATRQVYPELVFVNRSSIFNVETSCSDTDDVGKSLACHVIQRAWLCRYCVCARVSVTAFVFACCA